MVAAPLAMVYALRAHHRGSGFTAIQWHIVAMFAPGFVSTGWIISKIGARLTAAIGLLLILCAAGTNLLQRTSVAALRYFAASCWALAGDFGFIASTAMLATAYRPEEAAKVQAANEQVVFGVMAIASISSGLLLQLVGWQAINLLAIPVAAAAILALAFVARCGPLAPPACHGDERALNDDERVLKSKRPRDRRGQQCCKPFRLRSRSMIESRNVRSWPKDGVRRLS